MITIVSNTPGRTVSRPSLISARRLTRQTGQMPRCKQKVHKRPVRVRGLKKFEENLEFLKFCTLFEIVSFFPKKRGKKKNNQRNKMTCVKVITWLEKKMTLLTYNCCTTIIYSDVKFQKQNYDMETCTFRSVVDISKKCCVKLWMPCKGFVYLAAGFLKYKDQAVDLFSVTCLPQR